MYEDLITYANLANQILNNETDYFKDKNLIKRIFSLDNKDHRENIRVRLTIIDSFYSTNMNRRYYGIADMTDIIYFYYKDDQTLTHDLLDFIENLKNDQLLDIFNSQYGINKKGEKKAKAISLFSKYAYFLTDFQFPIYDSLVFETYPKLINKFPNLNLSKDLPTDIYFFLIAMRRFNEASGIKDFNKLDNLLWLTGKILRGNFSLILKEASYIEVINRLKFSPKIISKGIDEKVKNYIITNIENLRQSIDYDLSRMILFAKDIEK